MNSTKARQNQVYFWQLACFVVIREKSVKRKLSSFHSLAIMSAGLDTMTMTKQRSFSPVEDITTGGGTPWMFWWGYVGRLLKPLLYLRPKYAILRPTQFQTWLQIDAIFQTRHYPGINELSRFTYKTLRQDSFEIPDVILTEIRKGCRMIKNTVHFRLERILHCWSSVQTITYFRLK